MSQTEVDEVLSPEDLNDLDQLLDDRQHCYCSACQPHKKVGDPIITICGKRWLKEPGKFQDIPPEQRCPKCHIEWPIHHRTFHPGQYR